MNEHATTFVSVEFQERAQRQDAIDRARASMFLEGFKASPEYEADAQLYIDGNISIAELQSRALERVKLRQNSAG